MIPDEAQKNDLISGLSVMPADLDNAKLATMKRIKELMKNDPNKESSYQQ